MKVVLALMMLLILFAGCVSNNTTTTTVATTTILPETTILETTTSTTSITTTTPESVEQGIAITSTKSGEIAVKNIGRVREIYASELELYINSQKIADPKWTFTVIYPTSSMTSRVACNAGDTIRVVAPGNEDAGICVI